MGSANFDTDEGDLIRTIQDSVKTEIITADPGQFTSRPVHRVPEKDFVKRLGVASLTGIVDYLNKKIDDGAGEDLFVHVITPVEIAVRNGVEGREDRRYTPIVAAADVPAHPFGSFHSKEEFIIYLQSRFQPTEGQQVLLRQLGTLVAEEAVSLADDGTTQEVTVRSGINRAEEQITNPVHLRPFRTFPEIEQPESPFIVRLQKQSEAVIKVALFEADGGAWRNTARLSIKAFIEGHADGVPVIA